MNNEQPGINYSTTPSAMAERYGVSLPTFFAWLRNIILWHDPDNRIRFYKRKETFNGPTIITYKWFCSRKTIPPAEIKAICEELGDPKGIFRVQQNKEQYSKTTLSSIAEEKKISIKTFTKVISELGDEKFYYLDMGTTYSVHKLDIFPDFEKRGSKIRALTPKQAKIVLETYEGCNTF